MWGRFIALSGFYLATSLSSVSASEATALIDLDEAFARTLERNPALVIAGYQIDARRGSSLQAGLRPNPELDVTVEDVFGSGVFDGFDSAEVTLRLGWVLERGKRQRRVAAAEAGLSLAEVDMDIDRLDAVAATARYFLDSIAYQTRLERIESAIALAERTVSAVGERVQAGRSPDADLARAEADLARIRLSQEEIEHELKVSNQRLASQWGEVLPDFKRVTGNIDVLPEAPSFADLRTRIEQNPNINRYMTQRRLREAELRLAEAEARPDWRVNAGVRHLETFGDQALVAGITLPLAWRNRNQGRIAQARANLAAVDAAQQATRLQIESQLYALHQALEHSVHQATALREEILPRIERALADTQRAYASGRYGYLQLQLLQAEVLSTQTALVEATIDAHRHVIEIERLTGTAVTPWEASP